MSRLLITVIISSSSSSSSSSVSSRSSSSSAHFAQGHNNNCLHTDKCIQTYGTVLTFDPHFLLASLDALIIAF